MLFTSRLKRNSFIFLMLLLSVFGTQQAKASHLAAVDMYIDYIGTGPADLSYRITLYVYKACETGAIDLPTTAQPVTVTSSCGNLNLSLPFIGPPDTLSALCPQVIPQNSCLIPSSIFYAFVRHTFTTTFTLPSQCADWVFNWSLGARNPTIVNICSPSSWNLQVKAGLNNQLHYDNSTPRFVVLPIPYFCVNQPALFFNGPVDPNADSIVTINTQPIGCTAGQNITNCPTNGNTTACGPGGEIPYFGTYTLANPVGSPNGYNVDAASGIATFTSPSNIGKYVLAFKCIEYDRATGQQTAFITRDVQVAVLGCASGPPAISAHPKNVQNAKLDTTGGNFIIACPGAAVHFEMTSSSQSTSNQVTIKAPGIPSGMVFTPIGNGTSTATGIFDWVPTFTDIGDHIITIDALDTTCTGPQPLYFHSYLILYIKIVPGISAGQDKFGYCALNGTPVQLQASGPPNISYHWTTLAGSTAGINTPTSQTPLVTTNQTTSYVVTTNDLPPACKNRDTVIVNVDNSNSIKITPATPVILCRPGYMQLDATAFGPPPIKNLLCGIDTVTACTNQDSAIINVPYIATPLITGESVSSTPFAGNTMRQQYLIRASDLLGSGLHSGLLKGLTFFIDGVSGGVTMNNYKISLSCTSLNTLVPSNGFVGGMSLVYTSTAPLVVPISSPGTPVKFNFDKPYSWDTSKNLIVDICYTNASATPITCYYFPTANYYSTLYSTSGCAASAATGLYQVPQMRFNYCPAPDTAFIYTWLPGTFLSDSTSKGPVAYIPHSTKYYAYTRGRNGCKTIDSVSIYVPTHNYDAFPKDTAVCIGESVLFHATSDNTYAKFKWFQVDSATYTFSPAVTMDYDTAADPIAKPKTAGSFYYAVMITDSVSCSDTLLVHLTIKPLPLVRILNNDTTIKYGKTLQLLASGGYLYTWSPVGSLTDPNIVNPLAYPTEPVTYYLTGIGVNGCRNYDSMKVKIDYRDNLFVPTAFTPNGDGKNDEFKVVNLTFQRVMEFRVFNRWGQEIFSTTDNAKGWDGSWKGVAQDMGTYRYIIRVGYPDGYVETYKGDVTLVR